MQVRKLRGFPDTWGTHTANPIEHTGPSSYTSGGYSVPPSEFMVSAFVWVSSVTSYSGTYRVDPVYGGYGNRSGIKLRWVVVSTGQEVAGTTDLSGETVRLLVIGG